MDDIQIVKQYYNQSVESEWGRIANRPEFMLTVRFLERYISPGDSILDIGGGPGRYTMHLAEKGCRVTLFDLSDENVKFASVKARELGLPISAVCGDAREADKIVNEQFDHILLMGPLYHLLEEEDRVKAVNAAISLLKPGGTLFASFISMSGGLVYEMKLLPEAVISEEESEILFHEALMTGKSYAGKAFTQAFFINQNEVLLFMERFGLEKLCLFGQEGVTAPCEGNIMSQLPEVVNAWLDLSEILCEREEYLSWAEHLMYVGRKPDVK